MQGPEVEEEFSRTIIVSAEDPIDFVTVKSGSSAVVVSARFSTNSGEITLSKDVSGYIVWTCPPTTSPEPTVTATSPPTTSSPTSTT